MQMIGGLVQASGWPAVVTCVANWFGKGRYIVCTDAFISLLYYICGYMYRNITAVMGNLYFYA